MNWTFTISVAVLAWCAAATGKAQGRPEGPRVEICYELNPAVKLEGMMFTAAQTTASQLIAAAGVRLDWRHGKAGDCDREAQTIGIRFLANPPAGFPGREHAFASAMPYSTGATIAVYADRIALYFLLCSAADRPKILGHILAHEIVHMLEGVARHSETGLMKAHWSTQDLRTIAGPGLSMAAIDRHILAVRFPPTAAETTR